MKAALLKTNHFLRRSNSGKEEAMFCDKHFITSSLPVKFNQIFRISDLLRAIMYVDFHIRIFVDTSTTKYYVHWALLLKDDFKDEA